MYKINVDRKEFDVIKDAISFYYSVKNKDWSVLLNHPTFSKFLIDKYGDNRHEVIVDFIIDMGIIMKDIVYKDYDDFGDISALSTHISDDNIEINMEEDKCALLSNMLYFYTRIGYGDWVVLLDGIWLHRENFRGKYDLADWNRHYHCIDKVYFLRDKIIGAEIGYFDEFASVVNVDEASDISYDVFSMIIGTF